VQVARLAECHNNRRRVTSSTPAQKTFENNVRLSDNNISSQTEENNALAYWETYLSTKGQATKQKYLQYFKEFSEYTGKNPNELIAQRQQDLLNPDLKIQRRIETEFLNFIAKKRSDSYAVATQQIYFSSIRSFFEAHYFPLRIRRGDYPKGDSNGVKRATKEAILNILNQDSRNQTTINALITTLKDSGLRTSDIRTLNCNIILEPLARNPNTDLIQINIITQKTKLLAKTFLGKEAIDALKIYLESRRKGSQKVTPEKITNESPLFRTWQKGKVQRLKRTSLANLIRNSFLRANEKRMSPHSLRKKLQTDLEKAGINSNWIDQILGHQLINSRDAYSLPTDEELKEAYLRSYQFIRVYPEINKPVPEPKEELKQTTQILTQQITNEENYPVAEAKNMTEVKKLLAKGYKYEMEMEGIKLFVKK
jgi:integrase